MQRYKKKISIFLPSFHKLILVNLHLISSSGGNSKNMKSFSKRAYIRLVALFAFFAVTLTVYSAVVTVRVRRLSIAEEVRNQRTINELCESIDSITVDLQKCLYAASGDMLREQGNSLRREATSAKESLGQLTDETADTEEIFRFLSQVGNYVLALSRSDTLSEKDAESLRALWDYSAALNKELTALLYDFSDGTVSFDIKNDTLASENASLPEDFYTRMKDTAQTVTDYPTLLYDGPFSDSVGKGSYSLLKSEKSITRDEAKQIAAEFAGLSTAALRAEKDISGDVELYCFSSKEIYITVTKKGGFVHSFIHSITAGEATISPEEAVDRGLDYLKSLGYKNMKESYYSVYDGICTVNYAYVKSGVICYSDLIKVSISLDKGDVVALDASAWLSNHKARRLSDELITPEEARESLADCLTVLSEGKALIPTDYGKEVLCYEFHCKDTQSDSEVLVYIDCRTGAEQDIMLLLYEDDGILTR